MRLVARHDLLGVASRMTCHITMERIAPPTLNPAQLSFLRAHFSHIHRHQWHFAGTQLRASGEAGTATIWKDDLEHLVTLGLLRRGVGCADVVLTRLGKEACS